ncbi:MAG: hypothetical protein Q4F43_06910, partial [Eubacteriales bacterium]|nr:hypothetical protein [Eubacteriales bacterium]
MKILLEKIRKLLKDKRVRRFWTRIVSTVAALVVFVTTYALVLPAITMEKVAACGIEEHQHDDSCYEDVLICGQEESDGHMHDDSCFETYLEQTCELQEHQHTEDCLDEDGNIVCGLDEHVHDDSCFTEKTNNLCQLDESPGHHHDASCYERQLVCGKEVHTHSAACYPDTPEADDGEVESAAVASTQVGSSGAGTGSESDSDISYGNSAVTEMSGDADTTDDGLTVGVDNAEAGNAAAGNTAENGLPSDSYVPPLNALDFDTVLDQGTGVYAYAVSEGEVVEDSGLITDWKKVDRNTELSPSDLIRVYLSYTIPAGSLNETNPTARYRMPSSLHLTDSQVEGINAIENGIAAQY